MVGMMQIILIFNFLFVVSAFAKEEKPPVFAHPKELEAAIDAAKEGGSILMQYWNKGIDLEADMEEETPSTIADYESNAEMCKKLLNAFPENGLLSEKKIGGELMEKAMGRWRKAEWTWVVDPLDGARAFIAGQREFGIHIALLHYGTPVLGVDYYPVMKTLYIGVEGCGAYKQVRKRPLQRIRAEEKTKAIHPIVGSRKSGFIRSFYTALLGTPITDKMLRRDFKIVGSCGLGLCMIAEGKRNISVSNGERGTVWDSASGYVILKEAGGFVSDLQGQPLDFLAEDCKFHTGALFCGSKNLFEKAVKISALQ